MTVFAKFIFKTLALYDAYGVPLTLVEIHDFLQGQKKVKLSEIERVLETELSAYIDRQSGLYFLRGREALVSARKQRYGLSMKRLFMARANLRVLRHLPYLRAVAITGSLSYLNSTHASDIDLLIITAPGRVWLTRVLVSLYFQVLGRRRHGDRIAGRFCLNHYVAEGFPVLRDRDLHTATAYVTALPAIGSANYERFIQRNPWIAEFYPEPGARASEFFGFQFSVLQTMFEKILELSGLGPLLNAAAAWGQRRRIRQAADILVSESELSFHFATHSRDALQHYRAVLDRTGI